MISKIRSLCLIMPGRDGAPDEAAQLYLNDLRADRDRIWDMYLDILNDQERLSRSCTQFLNVQNLQGNGQTALTREYRRNWESRDKALDRAACERLREHAELGRVIEQLKDSWKKK